MSFPPSETIYFNLTLASEKGFWLSEVSIVPAQILFGDAEIYPRKIDATQSVT